VCVLNEVNLWEEVKDRLKNMTTTLSVGQQQRLSIARTLAVAPKILLMDELTSSLDPESVTAIESLIGSLKNSHTILLVTHICEQAEKVSDNLIFCNIIE
jgi:phosphate transport system ATP-binding protein